MMSPIALLGVVLRKEIVDGLRDRRSIISALVPLALLPLMVFYMFQVASDRMEQDREITVPVVGAEHAQALIDWLAQQSGVEITPGPSQPRKAVSEGSVEFVLVVPDDFGQRFARSKTAEVQIVVDSSDESAERAARRARSLIQGYGQRIASQRLIVRGVSPEVVRPVQVETVDLETEQERAAKALAFMPMLLVMTIFIGGLQIAIDSTAGERERGSLERLLANSVPRISIVGGKWLTSVAFSWASVALTGVLLLLILERSPLRELGLRLDIGPREIASIVLVVLPLALLVSALQMAVATLARSYKEAQSYVSFLMLVPVVPMVLMMDTAADYAVWQLFVPVLGQFILINDVIEGAAFEPLPYAIAALVAIAGAIGMLLLTARLFRNEKIVFGR